MVWPLTTTRSVSFSRTSRASPKSFLQILHDPVALFLLSPLIIRAARVDLNTYTITDRLTFLGCFHAETKYRCKFTFHANGVDAAVTASAGTKLTNHYRVHVSPSGLTEITEQTTIEGLSILMPFITKTVNEGHNAFFNNLVSKAENPSSMEGTGHRDLGVSIEQAASSPLLSYTPFIIPLALFPILWVRLGASIFSGTLLSGAIIGAVFITYYWPTTKDPYGLFHLTLNSLPGDEPGVPPRTEWLNMGFWRDTDIFPHACAALAIKLVQAAGCKNGGKVLDVGYGTGESLIFLLTDPRVPRPSSLTGITSLAEQHRRAQDRIGRLQSSFPEPKPEVALYAGDAVYHRPVHSHPLDPSSPICFDTILALDCAYHFNTRSLFLSQSFVKLVTGGRIALADLCFDPSSLSRGQTWLITTIFGLMPKQNIVSTKDYVSLMEEIGYVDVQLIDITDDVFPGFVKFLKARGWAWWGFALVVDWCVGAGARFVIVSGAKN